ncbi:ependymin [Takifugu rubripes]|uniref:Ependymin n=1 Tax=Takifugu rubripes TaxID=31033 RepID=H2UMP9_TAKRU|nr:ependymin-1-like [Takifugu rubripes]|eukprot:XP_003971162.1 PREDICTED: ependymin-1-like [Takifugu rubripes]
MGKMYAAAPLLVFICLAAATHADHHHHPCHPPNVTGFMSVLSMKGEVKAYGAITYDSTANKLRFRSNESQPTNGSLGLDLLMFFNEGIFYEIDSKNESCEKKKLHCSMHPLDVPDGAKFYSLMSAGNPSINGEGLKVNIWTGQIPDSKGYYSASVTMGCLPLSSFYFTESGSFLFSLMEIENEIKDPDLLVVPSICLGQPLEETPEGTVNSFLNEFI